MLLKEVKDRSGLSKKAIQYYEGQGFLHPEKLDNGYRNYDDECLHTLCYIKELRSLGMCVAQIRSILIDHVYPPQVYVEAMHHIDERMNELYKQKQVLNSMVKEQGNQRDVVSVYRRYPYMFIDRVDRLIGWIHILILGIGLLCYVYLPRMNMDEVFLLLLPLGMYWLRYFMGTFDVYAPKSREFKKSMIGMFTFLSIVSTFAFLVAIKTQLERGHISLVVLLMFCVLVDVFFAFHPFIFLKGSEFDGIEERNVKSFSKNENK